MKRKKTLCSYCTPLTFAFLERYHVWRWYAQNCGKNAKKERQPDGWGGPRRVFWDTWQRLWISSATAMWFTIQKFHSYYLVWSTTVKCVFIVKVFSFFTPNTISGCQRAPRGKSDRGASQDVSMHLAFRLGLLRKVIISAFIAYKAHKKMDFPAYGLKCLYISFKMFSNMPDQDC